MHHRFILLIPIPFTLQTIGGGTTGGSLLAEDCRGASRAPCAIPRATLKIASNDAPGPGPTLKIASNDAPGPGPTLKIACSNDAPDIVTCIVPDTSMPVITMPDITMPVIKRFEDVPDILASGLLSSVRCYTRVPATCPREWLRSSRQ